MKKYFKKLSIFLGSVFEKLSSRPKIGGLQITDSSVQYVLLFGNGDRPLVFSLNFPPGTVKAGKVQDKNMFRQVLKQLHNYISAGRPNESIKIVVSLPSAVTYSKEFNIPNVGEERLEEAVKLNLQMISPIPIEDAYMSWQIIEETPDAYEILGAFAEKQVVEDFRESLEDVGFYPVVFEFSSIALSWTINKVMGPKKEPALVINVFGDGIDIFLLKNGFIHFDYFRSWQSIQGANREIKKSYFEKVVVEEVKKVVSFTSNRFSETLKRVIVVAPGLEQDVKNMIERNFDLEVTSLVAHFGQPGPAWYTVIGSALRGSWSGTRDNFISLGTEKTGELLYRDQVISFILVWRNIFVGALILLLVFLGGASFLLRVYPHALEERISILNIGSQQAEFEKLKKRAGEFNALVAKTRDVKRSAGASSLFLETLENIGKNNDVVLDRIDLVSFDEKIKVNARAPDFNTVTRFKDSLLEDERFSLIQLPFSSVGSTEKRFISFSVDFIFTPHP